MPSLHCKKKKIKMLNSVPSVCSGFVQGTSKVSQIPHPRPPTSPSPQTVGTPAPGGGRAGESPRYPSTGMDCSKSDPNSSLYKGGKWARTMSGYIALKAVSFSVCLLHNARSVDTLHINCGERERERGDRLFRFTMRQGQGATVVKKTKTKTVLPKALYVSHKGQKHL